MIVRQATVLIILAILITLANAFKPLTDDDNTYAYLAAHVASSPLDPYGFEYPLFGPANTILAPPVLPYCFALAIRLFGGGPCCWKLILLPFVLLLLFCVRGLARRFARGLELPLTVAIVLSPVVLPGWNLMLDLPALALCLLSVTLFLRAIDRDAIWWAVLAGLTAGLAMQTKYTSFLAVPVFLLASMLFGRVRLLLAAASLALLVFVSWEVFTAWAYGASHFLTAFRSRTSQSPITLKLQLIPPLLAILGSAAMPSLLLGLAALRSSQRLFLSAAGAIVLALALVACVPARHAVWLEDPDRGRTLLTLNNVLHGGFGLAVLTSSALVTWVSCRRGTERWLSWSGWRRDRATWFLVLWLGLEIAGCFLLSPFPAVRRIIGIVVVGTLLAGRLAVRTCRKPQAVQQLRTALAASVLLGLFFFGVDFASLSGRDRAFEQTVQWAAEHNPGATLWYAACAPYDVHAERLGLKWLGQPGAAPRPGDTLAIVNLAGYARAQELPHTEGQTPLARLTVETLLPLRTCSCYYCGRSAIEHHEGPLAEVAIYRCGPPREFAEIALTARWKTATYPRPLRTESKKTQFLKGIVR